MGGRYAQRSFAAAARPLVLSVAGAEPLSGQLTALAVFAHEDGVLAPIVTWSTELGTYQRAWDEGVFGFSAATIAPHQGVHGLVAERPVDLELGLVPALVELLAAMGTADLEAVLDRLELAVAGDAPTLPLRRAESFRWLRVLQAQPAAPGMVIKSGFRSTFAR